MTFTGRLRLALVLAAILPTVLITAIVLFGLSQQVKRLESRDASAACARFTELLDNASARIERDLQYISDSREFQAMEWGLENQKPPDPKYVLPLLALDFVEYLDSDGKVIVSADRPALVGQSIAADLPSILSTEGRLVYENDLHGSHPSLALSRPTENGYIRGGIFLDGIFKKLAAAVTRSNLEFIDISDTESSTMMAAPVGAVGVPYRQDGRLMAVLAYDSTGQYFPVARFLTYHQQSLFSDFLTAVIVVTVFSLLIVIPAGLYFSSRTRREFQSLTGGALRVASGDFSQPVETAGGGEFADLADSFNQMMKQLTDYRERLIVSQKIAAWQSIGRKIAHEVKNPLTPISIAIDDLKHSYREHPADYEKILEDSAATIKGEVNRIKRLIDQFSTFAKMPPPEFSTITAAQLFRDIEVLFKDEMEQGKLSIENELGEAPLYLDPDQMRQVIINLIKNSIEAGAEHCRLELTVHENLIRVTIDDDGPGLPDKITSDGPTPYFSTKKHGSGLGLIICQRIVFDHEGTMNLLNKPDGGARVIITLPIKDA